jgi:hypothetical protein
VIPHSPLPTQMESPFLYEWRRHAVSSRNMYSDHSRRADDRPILLQHDRGIAARGRTTAGSQIGSTKPDT